MADPTLIKAFKCQHSDLYLPGDYIKQWGIKYGIGLGPKPVSECLDSHYYHAQGAAYHADTGIMMHPVGHCYADIQEVWITQEEFDAHRMILMSEDRDMTKRVAVILPKQAARKADMAKQAYIAAGGIVQ